MKKPSILLMLLPLILTGCANDNHSSATDSINSETSSQAVSTSEVKESETTTKETTDVITETEPEASTSTEQNTQETTETDTTPSNPEKVVKSIDEVKVEGAEFASKVNELGLYKSDVKAELKNLQLIAAQDMVSGKQTCEENGAVYNYKLMMTDGNDIIFIACDYNAYDMASKYEDRHQRYDVSGYIGYFNNQIEVFSIGDDVRYLKDGISKDYDFGFMANETTIENYYQEGEKAILNDKGVAYVDKLYTIQGKCLANNYNNNNVIFGNGDYIIEIHSHRYITNKFSVGKSYNLTGFISLYRYKMGMELASFSLINEEFETGVTFNKDAAQTVKAADLYKYNYTSDSKQPHPTNLNYTRIFYKPLKVVGYFDLSEKGGRLTGMIGDSIIPGDTYIKSTSIKSYKYLSITNENYVDLRDDVTRANTPLLDLMAVEIEFDILPSIWDTKGFPKVYVYDYK